MFYFDSLWFILALCACSIFAFAASAKVKSTYAKWGKVPSRSRLTGAQTAARLLGMNGVNDISLGKVGGTLSDHYHPAKAIVNLSQSTYDSASIGAVAVAAHEIGHVMQKKEGYLLYNLRTALVPVANFGSFLSIPLVLVGILLDLYVELANPNTGFYIAMLGVILYGGSFLFALVTLPVELDASRRARRMLLDCGILAQDELPGATKVLSAAAMTYLASLLTSLVYFLRFALRILMIFGRRDD